MSVRDLERRVAALERPNYSGIDPGVEAFDALSDTELGIIQEIFELKYAGFSDSEILEEIGEEQLAEMTRIMEKWKHEQNQLMGTKDGGNH